MFCPEAALGSKWTSHEIVCPPSNMSVTLLFWSMRFDVEPPEDHKNLTSLEELHGFGVNVWKGFWDSCHFGYTFRQINPREIDNVTVELAANGTNFALMNMESPRVPDFSRFHVSQPASVSPITLIYLKNAASGLTAMETFLFHSALMVLGLYVIGLVTLIAILKFDPSINGQNYAQSMWDFLFIPFGMSENASLKTLSGRIFTITWCMSWFFMTMLFSAELSSNLTISKLRTGMNSLQDLITQKRNVLWKSWIKDTHSDVVAEIKKRYDATKNVGQVAFENDWDMALEKSSWDLLENGYVFLSWYRDVKLYVSDEDRTRDDLVVKIDWSTLVSYHYAFGKTAEGGLLLDAFNQYIALKVDWLKKEYDEFYRLDVTSDGLFTNSNKQSDTIAYDMGPWALVLVMAGLAFVLALCVLMAQRIYPKIKKKRANTEVRCVSN